MGFIRDMGLPLPVAAWRSLKRAQDRLTYAQSIDSDYLAAQAIAEAMQAIKVLIETDQTQVKQEPVPDIPSYPEIPVT